MFAGIARRTLPFAVSGLVALAHGGSLTKTATYALDGALSAAPGNYFHPQGLGYDDAAGELLFAQEGTSKIVRTDLKGSILGAVSLGSPGNYGSYSVAVAADAGNYYVADYFANANGFDVLKYPKSGGSFSIVGSEKSAAYGTPLDVRGGMLYRTEPSAGNVTSDRSYGALKTVRISSLTAPDTILSTLSLNTPSGIGDLTVDLAGNALFVLGYGNGNVYRYDLSTGSLLDTYVLGLPSANAGLAYGNGSLYYYDWREGSGSSLSVYSLQAVPEPASLAALGLGALLLVRRRRPTA